MVWRWRCRVGASARWTGDCVDEVQQALARVHVRANGRGLATAEAMAQQLCRRVQRRESDTRAEVRPLGVRCGLKRRGRAQRQGTR